MERTERRALGISPHDLVPLSDEDWFIAQQLDGWIVNQLRYQAQKGDRQTFLVALPGAMPSVLIQRYLIGCYMSKGWGSVDTMNTVSGEACFRFGRRA